jgi:hypothetical protein
MFLAPGATYTGIPPQFAYPAAFGDLLAALLALAVIPLGPAYWIPAFWVPALLVTHYIAFIILWRYWTMTPKPVHAAGVLGGAAHA